ncbi:MAG: NAD(P)H-hydrate dehydratase [Planctomycetota bacterium]
MRSKPVRHIRAIPRLSYRRPDAHKGDFGRLLVIGGSRGMIGAPALAANAALRAGAGLVTVAVPEVIQLAVATLCPCATSIPLPSTKQGILDPRASHKLLRGMGNFGENKPSVVAGGPGLGRGTAAFEKSLLDLWLSFMKVSVALVLDADALNALHKSNVLNKRGWNLVPWTRTVITPHPGELARLHGVSTKVIQSDRKGWAVRTARELGAHTPSDCETPVVALKGEGTIVTDGRRVFINRTGNPGMATGGSGDVLTGIIAGFIAQGMTCFDAAVLGVHVHGRAGDVAAKELGQASVIATDVLERLPGAMKR